MMLKSHLDTPAVHPLKSKNSKRISPIGMSGLEDPLSDSVYDVSTVLNSTDNADSDDTENISNVSSVMEAFSKQF